jgi:hypothetical protein
MSWRKRLMLWSGPGFLGGITFGDWIALLRENHFAVEPAFWYRAAVITAMSLGNSLGRWRERARYDEKVRGMSIEPPLFILGVWRSGTTHLHNLFSLDPRLASPSWFEVSYAHACLQGDGRILRAKDFFVPNQRLQDNMQFGLTLPAEEEFALVTLTCQSPMLSWVFPRRAAHYDRYLTLRDVPQVEVDEWKSALAWFLKKLTWKHHKPLVLKSPANTGRIRLLLELFPNARFVHIHRNPYEVYRSAVHTNQAVLKYVNLQRAPSDVEERTIRQYKELYDAFFEERQLIPARQFHEVRYADLEVAPMGQMQAIYEALSLPEFADVEPTMQNYLSSLASYRKNSYAELPAETKARVAREWGRCFEQWNYPK